MNGLEAEFGEQIKFYRLDANVAENGRIQAELGLRGHPTVALLDPAGTVTARISGVQSAEDLAPQLAEIK